MSERTSFRPWFRVTAFVFACGLVAATGAIASARVPAPPTDAPTQVRLGWPGDTSTTMTVRWIGGTSQARVRPSGSTPWTVVPGSAVPTTPTAANPDGMINEATFIGLTPDSDYEYEVASFDTGDVRSFRTAPVAGGFEVAFVADTGVSGRTDGLATATRQVIDEIVAADPLLVLGGGDFVSFDSDDRFEVLGDSIDAWLRQMEPITARSAFMPTYGNHEVLLGEDLGQWVNRFATPEGTPDRSSYSFDVGGVHFVSLLGFESAVDEATEAWLVADLDAAIASGATKIVPYLHRNLYGTGTVHPPSPSLARQLARIFEQYPIDIVLTAHDQSYERTYPLIDGAPTSSARSCYTSADGITYIKSSPGGKISNISWDFSNFSDPTPDPQIAIRERGLHHYTILTVGDVGDVTVTTYGVIGDGSDPLVVDTVRYADSCPPEFSFSTLPQRFDIDEVQPTTIPFDVQLIGADETVGIVSGASWLTATAVGVDGLVQAAVDTTGLEPGTHATGLRATAVDGRSIELPIVVTIRGTDAIAPLLAYAGPDRSGPVLLDGATLRGDAYIGVPSDVTPITEVLFLVDDETARSDRGTPIDLVGGTREAADPWDTSALTPGLHTIEAIIVDADGNSTTAVARFTIADAAAADVPAVVGESYMPPTTLPEDTVTTPGGGTSVGEGEVRVTVPTADVLTLPPVTFGSIDIGESREGGGSWLTSWVTLVTAVLLAGLAIGAVGRRLRQRPPPDDAPSSSTGG